MGKIFICSALLVVYLFCTTAVYAGEAWPWVVGGIAGILTLSAIQDSHHRSQHREVHHYYHQPRVAPVYQQGPIMSERVWRPGGYDIDGNYHPGFYEYRDVIQ